MNTAAPDGVASPAWWDRALDRSLIGYGNVGYRLRRPYWPADPAPNTLRGKTAIVTGAKSGIGRATAFGLAQLGARVYMLVRGRADGERVRGELLARLPGAKLTVAECDAACFDSIQAFAAGFTGPVHVLVHNAGVMPPRRQTSVDGHELMLATHVLGPHLLTASLLPSLAAGAARVIWVSSGGMYGQRLHFADDDVEYHQPPYRPAVGYARTKRMQASLASEWARHLGDDAASGARIAMYAMHPGWVATPGLRSSLPRFQRLAQPLLRTPQQGADTIIWLAAADHPRPRTGLLWHDRAPRPWHYLNRTRDTPAERRALWDLCRRLTGSPGPVAR